MSAGQSDGSGARPEVCVGAVVIANRALLLVLRATSPGEGRWSIPGGRVEAGETLSEALRREVHEETGIEVEAGELIGVAERRGAGYHFVILDYYAWPRGDDPMPVVAGSDAKRVSWVPLSELEELPLVDGLADFLSDHGVLDG
jgi:8-oxo-dGTP diphosphatase